MTRSGVAVAAFALVLASLGFAASGFAQYRPPEPLPEPIPAPDPSPTPAPEGQEPENAPRKPRAVRRLGWRWEPGVVLDGGWERNPGFARPPLPDYVFGAATASLAGVRRGPRSEFRAAVSGTGYAYRDFSNRNRVDAFANISVRGPLSRRTEGRLVGTYGLAHTDSDYALINAGIILPLDRTHTAGASGDLTWRAAERTSLSLGGSWFYTNFESERFLDTTSYLGTLSLTRRVSRRDYISANASLQTTVDDLTTRRIPAFYAGYGHLFGTSLQLGLAAGAARDDNYYAEEVTPPWTFYGSANLSGRIRRVTLNLSYSRGLQPLIGLGVTQVTDSLGLGLELPIGRRFRLLANGVLALRATPLDTAARRLEWDAYFGGSAALSERISLALGYRFRRREDPLGMLSNDRASVSLVYAGRPR